MDLESIFPEAHYKLLNQDDTLDIDLLNEFRSETLYERGCIEQHGYPPNKSSIGGGPATDGLPRGPVVLSKGSGVEIRTLSFDN